MNINTTLATTNPKLLTVIKELANTVNLEVVEERLTVGEVFDSFHFSLYVGDMDGQDMITEGYPGEVAVKFSLNYEYTLRECNKFWDIYEESEESPREELIEEYLNYDAKNFIEYALCDRYAIIEKTLTAILDLAGYGTYRSLRQLTVNPDILRKALISTK